jgi:DNA-binding MarR family transcriptional regulator
MKKIKLTGRELAVMRALDFANGNTGAEIAERTHIEAEDLVDILNGMCDTGYMEPHPYVERVTEEDFAARHFDVNPSYALELKEAIRRY